ncbi:hypothetical protein J6590_103426 [Homalodisca vitripennis]|nr:hypothetical protein J6590_103426 [Homalodisca vitripennis]
MLRRLVVGMLMFLKKLVSGVVDCSELLARINFAVFRPSARQRPLFSPQYAISALGTNSSVNVMMRLHNALPRHVDLLSSSPAFFKQQLNKTAWAPKSESRVSIKCCQGQCGARPDQRGRWKGLFPGMCHFPDCTLDSPLGLPKSHLLVLLRSRPLSMVYNMDRYKCQNEADSSIVQPKLLVHILNIKA